MFEEELNRIQDEEIRRYEMIVLKPNEVFTKDNFKVGVLTYLATLGIMAVVSIPLCVMIMTAENPGSMNFISSASSFYFRSLRFTI